MLSRSGWHDAYSWKISPDQIYEMCPYIKLDGIVEGLYNPGI